MLVTLLKHARTLFAAAMVLAIPAYAIFSMTPGVGARSANVALADEDDPIRNGLNIIARPPAGHPQLDAGKTGGDSDVILLTDWVFTAKGKPSPYN
jgi:hypothetical protein